MSLKRPLALKRSPASPTLSRFLGLTAPLLALAVLALLLPVSPAAARNPYEYVDSSEGDPGDGVLRPVPTIDLPLPTPKPAPAAFTILCFTLDPGGDYLFDQPVVVLLPAGLVSRGMPAGSGPFLMMAAEGRWHDAP